MKRVNTSTVKKIRKVNITPATTKSTKVKKVGLSKKDPLFYSKIGQLSAERRALSSEDYAEMAKKSHPRREYRGGRKKKVKPEDAAK